MRTLPYADGRGRSTTATHGARLRTTYLLWRVFAELDCGLRGVDIMKCTRCGECREWHIRREDFQELMES